MKLATKIRATMGNPNTGVPAEVKIFGLPVLSVDKTTKYVCRKHKNEDGRVLYFGINRKPAVTPLGDKLYYAVVLARARDKKGRRTREVVELQTCESQREAAELALLWLAEAYGIDTDCHIPGRIPWQVRRELLKSVNGSAQRLRLTGPALEFPKPNVNSQDLDSAAPAELTESALQAEPPTEYAPVETHPPYDTCATPVIMETALQTDPQADTRHIECSDTRKRSLLARFWGRLTRAVS